MSLTEVISVSASGITKPFAYRPPIVPPISTTFDGRSGGEPGDSDSQYLEVVEQILANAKRVHTRGQAMLYVRVAQNAKYWGERILAARRGVSPDSLPPPCFMVFEAEAPFVEEDPLTTAIALRLNELDRLILELKSKI